MMVVMTSGYIVSVLGPYHMIKKNAEEMRNWLHNSDTFIVDHGVRNSADVLSNIGIRMFP